MTDRLLPLGETFESPAVHEKDVEPAIIVVVVESDAASGGLEQVLVLFDTAKDRLCSKPCLPAGIYKFDAQ